MHDETACRPKTSSAMILKLPARNEVLRVQIIRDFAQLQELAPEWSALMERSSCNEPMLSPTWLCEWWRIYGERYQLAVGAFYDGEQLVGLAPMLRRRFWHKPGIPFRRLEFLGADVDEEDGVCSDYLGVIAERGMEERVARAFATAARRKQFGSWDEIELSALAGDNPMTNSLEAAFRDCGYLVQRQVSTLAPCIALPATWDEYLKALPKKHRYGIVRAQRDFDEWAAGSAVLHQVRKEASLEEGRLVLRNLHSERWQAAGQKGAFSGQRFAAFHDAIMPRLLADQNLELMWLSVRGEPVAAMYNIVWNNKVYFYQSGRKMDVPRNQRLGIVMVARAVEYAIASGRREFDFLGDNTLYKKQMALATRPIARIRVSRRTLREAAHRLADRALVGYRKVRALCRRRAPQPFAPAQPGANES